LFSDLREKLRLYFQMSDPDGHELSFAHPLERRGEIHAGG
jgi:hypothetical protein